MQSLESGFDDVVSVIPAGKLRCIITGTLRRDTKEEHVRQRIARSLLEDYGYAKEDIEVEFSVQLGRSKKRVDLAIFPPKTTHFQENALIIVECKNEDVKPSDRDNGVEQLKSYMAACLNAKYGMWIGSQLQVWEKTVGDHETQTFVEAADIPRAGEDAPEPLSFAELVPGQDELVGVFKRCHDYIYGNQGLQKEPAFQELLKLIFCKVFDEDTSTGKMKFFISNEDRRSDIGQRHLRNRIDALFDEVKGRYQYIFSGGEAIKLDNRVLAYVVGELQRFSLLQTRTDVKGAAYEQLVGANLRGDRGEFFTPRNVCEMAVRLVLATFPNSDWRKLKIVDPACGTGGFLVATMSVLWEHLYEAQLLKWNGNQGKALEESSRHLRDMANSNIMGIDFNPILVRAAQMNLVMHGDGSTNVFHANSLLPPGEWPDKAPNNVRENIGIGTFDVVLTNPPFGSKISIDDPHVLDQFSLSAFGVPGDQRRSSMPPEQLFIERCLQLLKPGGKLAIVLPDSILSNPGLSFIREWVLSECRILASIDLPQETFQPHTGTQTSVLMVQKKTPDERRIEEASGQLPKYEIFMAIPSAVGHDRRGNPVYLRTPEGDIIEYEEETPIVRKTPSGYVMDQRRRRTKAVSDDLPEVVHYFREWKSAVDHPSSRARPT